LIEVENIIDIFLKKSFDECYENLEKVYSSEDEYVFDDVDQNTID
jgi:hypothetical protein